MLLQIATFAGILLGGLAALALVYVVGMRVRSPLVLGPLIRLQRTVINPRQMASAGTSGGYASVIRHRGRTSGRSYETPVGAVATDDGFAIALVYGPRTNWLRNVLASGSAELVHEGQTFEVDRPEIVPMASVIDRFAAGDRRGFGMLGVVEALRVRRVGESNATARSGIAA